MGARVLEERRAGHERGVVDVGARDLADQGPAGKIGHLAQVVGHVPDRGDPAVEVLLHHGLGKRPVGRRGQMLVAVDQAGQDIEPRHVDHAGAWRRRIARWADRLDALAPDQDRDATAQRRARPIDQGRVAVEDQLVRLGQAGPGRWCASGASADRDA